MRRQRFEAKMDALARARTIATDLTFTPAEAAKLGFAVSQDGARRNVLELLAYPEIDMAAIARACPEFDHFPHAILCQLENDSRYAPYLARQEAEVSELRRAEAVPLPADLDYDAMPGLSNELRLKLGRVRPRTLAQAGRIEGMTPAALTLILMRSRQAVRLTL
jgi:tRNA uridine 5-carboxymethylaminomethyl modification enzyme